MKSQTAMLITIAIICFTGGIYLGMILQQMILTASFVEIAEGLEGTHFEVNIDLNETEIMEGVKEIYTPILKQALQGINSSHK